MTNAVVPYVLRNEPNDDAVVNAVYFAVRILRNSQRGYKELATSTESGRPVRKLTERTLAEIEGAEGCPLTAMSELRVDEYIKELEVFSAARAMRDDNSGQMGAASMLRELRDLPL